MNYLTTVIDSLLKYSYSVEALDIFISKEMNDIYEIDNHCHVDCKEIKDNIDKYIKSYHSTIENLDYSKKNNAIFALILIGYCERFGLRSSFQYMLNILSKNKISLPSRIQAAEIYFLTVIITNNQYISALKPICQLIQISINEEESDSRISICSFLNFYNYVARNIPHYREKLVLAIIDLKNKQEYDFLQEEIIIKIITLTGDELSIKIEEEIDKYIQYSSYRTKGYNTFVIEENTKYQEDLEKLVEKSFSKIRQLSINKALGTDTPVSRGCNPITNENDLFLYFRSYGNMHYAKIHDALTVIPLKKITQQQIEIISWGCGQGIEAMVLLQEISPANITSISLIEPSDLALKRASLHVHSLLIDKSKIYTICKYINDLTSDDLKSIPSTIKIHLFSNILDIPTISLSHLKQLITSRYQGLNYFICVSPYERLEKAQRLEQFKSNFEKCKNFSLLKDETNTKGSITYWLCNQYFKYGILCTNHPLQCNGNKQWTRITKVFNATL